jgi:hypothetical protein
MRPIWTTTIVALFLVAGCSHVPARVGFALDGIWMDESYRRVLQTSLSPKAASSITDIPVLRIDKDKKTLTVSYSFHEEDYCAIKHISNGTGNIALETPDHTLKAVSVVDERIVAEYESYDKRLVSAGFVKISPPIDAIEDAVHPYVAQVVLAGDYRDDQGRLYSFGPRTLNWAGQSYEYGIWVDFVLFTPMDVIAMKKEGTDEDYKTYGFATNGVILQLYEYDDDTKRIGNLVLELRKE